MSTNRLRPEIGRIRPVSGTEGGGMTDTVRLLRESGGSLALRFAFLGPAVFLLVVGGVDLLAVNRSQDRLQSIADGAAAAGVQALGPKADPAAARGRAQAFVAERMRQWPAAPDYEARYEIVEQSGRPVLRVVLRGHRQSFLANMLPPGGWHFVGDASANLA